MSKTVDTVRERERERERERYSLEDKINTLEHTSSLRVYLFWNKIIKGT